MYQKPFITKLHLVNFRSIRDAVIEFDNPLFLVGHNGTGKSNILDALLFLSECLSYPLPETFRGRQRISNALKNDADAKRLGLRIDFQLSEDDVHLRGHYAFSLRKPQFKRLVVEQEQCRVTDAAENTSWFNRSGTSFSSNFKGFNPSLSPNSLSLPIVGGLAQFAPLVKAISEIQVYDISSKTISDTSDLDGNTRLNSNGSNLASVIHYLAQSDPKTIERINHLLHAVLPGISSLYTRETAFSGERFEQAEEVTIVYEQEMGDDTFVRLDGEHLSAGTLNILALIVASMQTPPPMIAIEEPETGLHPGALETIAEIIELAGSRTQVVVTTHSPDLLDAKWIRPENIRVVSWGEGETSISRLGVAPVKMLQEHLMGAGELMRANALDEQESIRSTVEPLFDEIAA